MRIITIDAIRKRSQKLISLKGKSCEECGIENVRLHRHHTEMKAESIKILCVPCHVQEHIKIDGKWGSGKKEKKPKDCVICEKEFIPRRPTVQLCGNKKCCSELGRRSAMKRYGG